MRATISSRRSAIDGRAATTTRSAAAGRQPAVAQSLDGTRDEVRRVGVRPRASSDGKSVPTSPSAAAPKQRVDEGVERGVAVGVALRPARLVREGDAGQAHRAPVDEPMGVEADPPPSARSRVRAGVPPPRAASCARIGTRSAGSVSLRLAGSPGTTWTGTPAAARAPASSVIGRPQACASSIAARSAPRRAACGVWAATTSSRSTGATTRSPPHALQGVDDRHDRHDRTAHLAAGLARRSPRDSGVTAGRAAS